MTIPIEMPVTAVVEFENLMRSHERRILRLAIRLTGNLADAQDAAQEVFMRLHRHLASLPDENSVERWLHRVTVNVCFDMGRRMKSSRRVPIDGLARSLASVYPSAETLASRREGEERIAAALRHLGKRERAALVLRDLEGLTTAEVAETLGSTESTVRVQISKARLKLRELLKELQ
ncbi:MAG: sigma-70 family RNA polymerase sigma factor [Bryobacteraceae bacterium]|nr:sigma-70 family RNA polymerase sigma factor [Bryobacteraceae bacterium]